MRERNSPIRRSRLSRIILWLAPWLAIASIARSAACEASSGASGTSSSATRQIRAHRCRRAKDKPSATAAALRSPKTICSWRKGSQAENCWSRRRQSTSKTSVMAGCGLAFEPNFGVEGSGSDAVEVAVVMERILLTAQDVLSSSLSSHSLTSSPAPPVRRAASSSTIQRRADATSALRKRQERKPKSSSSSWPPSAESRHSFRKSKDFLIALAGDCM
mmetsp:Transcript_73721/g.102416  ORF Transcript_73721/g.102416 Transcript_73721/m.102416 type:complete len:218 (-) Transcript_73721:351-1004(-)